MHSGIECWWAWSPNIYDNPASHIKFCHLVLITFGFRRSGYEFSNQVLHISHSTAAVTFSNADLIDVNTVDCVDSRFCCPCAGIPIDGTGMFRQKPVRFIIRLVFLFPVTALPGIRFEICCFQEKVYSSFMYIIRLEVKPFILILG